MALAKVEGKGSRDEMGNLMEFERPVKQIMPDDLAMAFHRETPSVKASTEPGWEIEVSLGRVMDKLPGTYVDPSDFVSFMDGRGRDRDLLLGNSIESKEPLVSMGSGFFRLNVFGGSNSRQARIISQIGSLGKFDYEDREEYQAALFSAAVGVWRRTSAQTRAEFNLINDARPLLNEEDDCGATVVTGVASGRVVDRVLGLGNFAGRRVDLGVMTAHSAVMWAMEAERLRMFTEVNVGYLGWGLTEGLGLNKDHKNYLATVDGIDAHEKGIMALGDMGDGARRIPDSLLPWESIREDDYFERESATNITWAHLNGGNLRLAYAMGGLMIEGMRRVVNTENDSVIMARGKRVSNENGEFVARFGHLVGALEAWK